MCFNVIFRNLRSKCDSISKFQDMDSLQLHVFIPWMNATKALLQKFRRTQISSDFSNRAHFSYLTGPSCLAMQHWTSLARAEQRIRCLSLSDLCPYLDLKTGFHLALDPDSSGPVTNTASKSTHCGDGFLGRTASPHEDVQDDGAEVA